MSDTWILADAVDGTVHIRCTPADARALADAFATAYATCADLEADRPRWMDDVIAIHTAAAHAEVQAGQAPTPVLVPIRHLQAVPSEGSAS